MRYTFSLLLTLMFTPAVCAQSHPTLPAGYTKFADEYTSTLVTAGGTIYGSTLMPTGDSTQTVVLIVSDSGPTDRDGNQNMMRSNTLKMLAFYLAENNIATLRFDKRGVGGSQNVASSRNAHFESYVGDVKSWVMQLRRDGRFRRIILLGHGEGATLAMEAINQGAKVNALISLAGNGRTVDQLLKDQLENQPQQVKDVAYDIIDSLKAGHQVRNVPFFLAPLFRAEVQPFVRSIMEINPQASIRNVNCPILIVQGDTDLQTKVEDARLLHAANPNSRLVIIPGMNHVLKDCPTIDRSHQEHTMFNPAIPLNQTLEHSLLSFINHL